MSHPRTDFLKCFEESLKCLHQEPGRPLWEHFYPRVRRETDPQAAAEIVLKALGNSVRIASGGAPPADIRTMWENGSAEATGFEAVYVAALRSVGIPAKLSSDGLAQLLSGGNWTFTPRPINEPTGL